MIIPAKYQWSSENDPDNSSRINNITKKYINCIKKFGSSFNNKKSISNKDNQGFVFQTKVVEWFFNLSFIDRVKVSTINNKWVFQTLHQLYIEQKKNHNLKFVPRFTGKNIPFIQKLKGQDIFPSKPSDFLNYFAFFSEKYELINGYNEKIEKEFLNEIIFIYPNLTKTAKIQTKQKDEDLIFLLKYHYPIFTLSESVLTNKEKFEKYFKSLSNNNYFVKPPEVISPHMQKESNNNIDNDNNIINSFNSLNPLNNIMKNSISINNNNSLNENNSNSNNNSYNTKVQSIIDLPFWANQPIGSKLCFSINELFLAFFEQNISIYYILYLYENQFYNSLLNDNNNTILEEFISLKKDLKNFLCINQENLLNILNIDIITKDIYYNFHIEKFVDTKKYKNNLIASTKFWKENISFEEEYNYIKEYFNGYNNDNDSMTRLINDISMFNIEQIYSYEEFFLNKVFLNLNKKYENNKEEDLLFDLTSNNNSQNKKKKKRNKKKKKNKGDGENNENNNKNTNNINDDNEINNDNKNDEMNNNIKLNSNDDKKIEIKKLTCTKTDSIGSNKSGSIENENNISDAKSLLPSDDYQQIMKDNENKYNIYDENENNINKDSYLINENYKNDNTLKNDNKENINDKEKNINNQNKINQEDKTEEKNKDNNNKSQELKNENENEKIEFNKINAKKKKGNNFFLYPTIKKTNNEKNNKPPFIMKFNEDILTYNKNLLDILDALSPIKEHIIETIKSHVKSCFVNENYLYQLEIYGSFKSNLDIVCSDIDMVFIPQKSKNVNVCDLILKLSNHFSSLNKYFKVTPIYTASIPLIKLMIKYENYLEENKSLLDNYSKLINSSLYQNYPYDKEKELAIVNIDISFPVNSNNKKKKNSPFNQIEFIKNTLFSYPEANIVIRILKRALKLTDMNNSYKGGLSSYTIFLLVASYMKHVDKSNNMNNNKHKSNSYGHAFHDIVKYYSKFDFYTNYIDIGNKNGDIFLKKNKKYNSHEYENIPIIIDPVTGLNAGKSTFRINDVQNVFITLNEELEKLRNIYDTNNNNKNENKDNIENDKDKDNNNLIITLLKNVEGKYLNK